ncbi:MAG: phosphate starvation-inducible protein PhoH [Alphaproteobacteria bacterium]|nr:phosphate starvation-inducible protein PhoH [Alphaproteobacteria bacterium]
MTKQAVRRVGLQFDDNALVPLLFGEHDMFLAQIEEDLDIEIASRGNEVVIIGSKPKIVAAQAVFDVLWERLLKGLPVATEDVTAALNVVKSPMNQGSRDMAMAALKEPQVKLKAKNKQITPRTPKQAEYLEAIKNHALVFGLGPAGTGKTFLAVAQAVMLMQAGEVDRMILTRPAVEAGESLGFLPGTMQEKIDPYLRPIYDALNDMLPPEQLAKRLADGTIEIAPLAFMRGRTLGSCVVILDEAQNTTPTQMKMALTRIGENSKMIITGDLSQTDLPHGQKSGLRDAVEVLKGAKDVAFVAFGDADVVRSRLVREIVAAYEKRDAAQPNKYGKDTP